MPGAVAIVITVSTLLAALKVIVNVSVPPSAAVGLLMVSVGKVAVLSVIVPVPLGLVLTVLPLVTVPDSVNVSLPSVKVSAVVGTFTITEVCPAGMVTVVFTVV